jgi:hypothetical protein
MQSKRQRRNAQLRRQHAASRLKQTYKGIKVYHDYPESMQGTCSWWDDLAFRIGSQVVAVSWRHLRQAYQEEIRDLSYKAMAPYEPAEAPAMFDFNAHTKIYRKIGNGRKKLSAYQMDTASDLGWAEYYQRRRDMEEELLQTSVIAVKPRMTVTLSPWSKHVELVCPFEVRSEPELLALAAYTKALLTRRAALPNVSYSAIDWIAEESARTQAEQAPEPTA